MFNTIVHFDDDYYDRNDYHPEIIIRIHYDHKLQMIVAMSDENDDHHRASFQFKTFSKNHNQVIWDDDHSRKRQQQQQHQHDDDHSKYPYRLIIHFGLFIIIIITMFLFGGIPW